jgi:hypothetical protein
LVLGAGKNWEKMESMSRAEEEALLRIAREIAVGHEAQIPQLNNDLIDAEKKKTEIQRELHTARVATNAPASTTLY